MDRDKQIEMMKTVEERTQAHGKAWAEKSPRIRAALQRQIEKRIAVPRSIELAK